MLKFRVLCRTTKYYRLMVEAPSLDAVKSFYYSESDEWTNTREFHPDEEEGWDLVSIREVAPETHYDGVPLDVRVNSEGEPIEGEE